MVKHFLRDFRNFLQQGNVIELAIAVVIGGAFGKVVDALVSLVMGQLHSNLEIPWNWSN